jgi:hypothetical protein
VAAIHSSELVEHHRLAILTQATQEALVLVVAVAALEALELLAEQAGTVKL